MSKKTVFLDAPNVGNLEKRYLAMAVDSGFVSTFGPFVQKFEETFARYIGVTKAVSTQSGTEALHVALHELGIGEGDEVIVPALTFVATANPIVYVKAAPVFVDVDKDSWNIDPREIERHITRRTKAVVPVHFYGNPCDMDRIMGIARKHGLAVIEDATESLGAFYNKKHTGTIGDLGCFSFNGNKVITTGGGGMVVGTDPKRLEHIKFLVNQGRDETRGYYHPEIGFNYRMTNLEAALGLAQLKRLNEFLNKKQVFNALYREELSGVRDIRFQKEYRGARGSWWFTCVVFERPVDLPTLQKVLLGKGVPTRRVFTPITEFPPYKKFKKSDLAHSYDLYERGLCLPSSTLNSEQDVRTTAREIKRFLKRGL